MCLCHALSSGVSGALPLAALATMQEQYEEGDRDSDRIIGLQAAALHELWQLFAGVQ